MKLKFHSGIIQMGHGLEGFSIMDAWFRMHLEAGPVLDLWSQPAGLPLDAFSTLGRHNVNIPATAMAEP